MKIRNDRLEFSIEYTLIPYPYTLISLRFMPYKPYTSKKTLISNPLFVSFIKIKDTNNVISILILANDTNKSYLYHLLKQTIQIRFICMSCHNKPYK